MKYSNLVVLKTLLNVKDGVARYTDSIITPQTRIIGIRSEVNTVSTNIISNITPYDGYCDIYFNNTSVSTSVVILLLDNRKW